MSVRIKNVAIKTIVAVASASLTVFSFASAYEVLAEADVPIVNSVQQFRAQKIVDETLVEYASKLKPNDTARAIYIENMDRITIEAANVDVQIADSLNIDGRWYARPSFVHYIPLNKDEYGVVNDYVFYAKQSWRSIAVPNQIEEGMEVQVHYGAQAYTTLVVKEKAILDGGKTFIPERSEERQVVFYVEDTDSNLLYAFSLVGGAR